MVDKLKSKSNSKKISSKSKPVSKVKSSSKLSNLNNSKKSNSDFESIKKMVMDKLSDYDPKKVKDTLNSLSSDIEVLIKVYPVQSILIAIVIGLIIGRLTKRK